MADDVVFQSSTPATPPAGVTIAADDVGGKIYQRVKLAWGVDGSASDTSASAPLPVVQTGTPALPSGAATETTVAAILAKIIAAPMTEATGAAILAKLIAAPATEATTAALLASLGATSDAAATGDGSAIALLKQLRTLYAGGLPAALVSGRLDVNVGASALPSGAATAANQATANTALASIDTKLDALTTPADTQPISAASLPLPTGAATAAKQPALGTAGTASADVLSVQGIASMTPLLVNGSGVTQPVSDAGGSLTVDGTVAATQSGTWNVTNISGTVSLPTGAATETTLAAQSAKLPASLGQKTSANSLAVVVASDQSAVPVSGTFWQATQPVSGTVTANLAAGTNNIGDVDVLTLPALPAGNNNIGDVDVASLPALAAGSNLIGAVNVRPGTSGGLTIYRSLDVNATGASVKGSAGQVFGWFIFNAAAATRYVKLYNTSSAPTVGTTTPVLTIPIPAGAAANVEFTNGIAFGTGIGIGATTALADNSTAAPTANDVIVNLLYA